MIMRNCLSKQALLAVAGSLALALVSVPRLPGAGHRTEADAELVNPGLRDYYQKHAKEIEELQAGVKKASRNENDRLADFRKLRARYPDAAVATAAEVVGDKSEKIASF